jgi:hypothetical protein
MLANVADQGGTHGVRIQAAGLTVFGVGALTENLPATEVGLAGIYSGGAAGVVAGYAQFGAGILQGIGNGDYSNATDAALTVGAGKMLSGFVKGPGGLGGSVSGRNAQSFFNSTAAVTGGVYNSAVSFLQDLAPHQTTCGSSQN